MAGMNDPLYRSGDPAKRGTLPGSVNVRDFGAKGDGAIDDTAAIKAAVASVSSTFNGTGPAGIVAFPRGSYRILSTIEVPPGVILRGLAGRFSTNLTGATIVKEFDGVAVRLVRRNAAPGNLWHMGGVEDMGFSGQGASDTTASRFIELGDAAAVNTSTGAWDVFIRRNVFNNSRGYAIYSAHSQEARIDENRFSGVKFPIYYATVVASTRITRNEFLDESGIAGAIAMQFRPGTLGGAAALHIWGNYSIGFVYGLWLTSILGSEVTGNSFEGVYKVPIVLEKHLSDDVTVDGNGCQGWLIQGNTFINWANDATDNPAIRLNYARNGVLGTNTYQSPNGAATRIVTMYDAGGPDLTSHNVLVEPRLNSGVGGTPAPFQINNTALTQNTIIGRQYMQQRHVAGDVPTAGFGVGENGRTWWDQTNLRFRFWHTTGPQSLFGSFFVAPAYGATVTIDCGAGDAFSVGVTNGNAFTIASPTNANAQQQITVQISNSSGGAMGAITWGAAYRLAGAFVNPATGFNRSVTFLHRSGVWYETSRTAADAGN